MSTELLTSVAALSEDERVELVGYIEQTLGAPVAPTAEQQTEIEHRIAEMKANPGLGMSKRDAVTAARELLA